MANITATIKIELYDVPATSMDEALKLVNSLICFDPTGRHYTPEGYQYSVEVNQIIEAETKLDTDN